MKRYIKSSKSYDFLGYKIYDNGYGFEVYLNGRKVGGEFATAEEAEDYIEDMSDFDTNMEDNTL